MGNKLHADLAPSKAHKWVNCPGSARLEKENPQQGPNNAAAEGTAAHFLASETLQQGHSEVPYEWYQKRSIHVGDTGAKWYIEGDDPRGHYYITPEMYDHVNTYVKAIREAAGPVGQLLTEHSLNLEPVTGERHAKGTPDAIILFDGELQIHDLKYGMKPVNAEGNLQLLTYALAALEEYFYYGINKVVLAIHQPRLSVFDAWTIDDTELVEYRDLIKAKAAIALSLLNQDELPNIEQHLNVGDHCTTGYCSARHTCPALLNRVEEATGFTVPKGDDNEVLAEKALLVPLIRGWCDNIESNLKSKVLGGEKVPGFKIVEGRAGNREWVDAYLVESILKSMKISSDVMYKKTLNSPTVLEKAAKAGDIGPRQWPKLKEHIFRKAPGLDVVSELDKRPAVDIDNPINLFD